MAAAVTVLLLAAPGLALGALAAWACGASWTLALALVLGMGAASTLMGIALVVGGSNRR